VGRRETIRERGTKALLHTHKSAFSQMRVFTNVQSARMLLGQQSASKVASKAGLPAPPRWVHN
jgi:hypothetical protein